MATRMFLVTLLIGFILPNVFALGADNQIAPIRPTIIPPLSDSSTRVALVIGNASYPKDPLPFTINDATEMAQTLSALGFDVTVATNVNLKQMQELTADFVRKAQTAKVALFYFAGHGESHMEGVVGENFLLPVEVSPGQGRGNFSTSIPVSSRLLNPLATSIEKRISIIILDACRTPSVTRHQDANLKAPSRYQVGLAEMSLPSGTFVAYAAAPGTAAFESPDSKHGRFTQSLLKHMPTRDLTIEQVFKRVRSDVEQLTDFKQSPREESSLRGDQDFSFVDSRETGRAGRITSYVGLQEPAPRSSNVTAQREVLNTIRTTPAPSRMRALRELVETRALRLSVPDAEQVLSYFWVTARRKALLTMAPQFPDAMSLEDAARLIQKSSLPQARSPFPSFEELKSIGVGKNGFGSFGSDEQAARKMYETYLGQEGSRFDTQQIAYRESFELLKSLGKVDPKSQFEQLTQQLRAFKSEDRCAEERDQDMPPHQITRAAQQDVRPSDASANQQLLALVRNKAISLSNKRQLIKNLFKSHRIELSVTDVVEVLKELPEEARGKVLIEDLTRAVPDYVPWSQLPILLKLIEKRVTGGETTPRGELISYWVDEGILNANLSRHERTAIDKLLHEGAMTKLKDKTEEVMPGLDEAVRNAANTAARNSGMPAEVLEQRMKQMMNDQVSRAIPMVGEQLVGSTSQILDQVMACNERASVSFFPKK